MVSISIQKEPIEEFQDNQRVWLKVENITDDLYSKHFKPTQYNTDYAILTTKQYVPSYLKNLHRNFGKFAYAYSIAHCTSNPNISFNISRIIDQSGAEFKQKDPITEKRIQEMRIMNTSANNSESSLGNNVDLLLENNANLSSENESLNQKILDMEKKIKDLENDKHVMEKKIEEWESPNVTVAPISLVETEILNRFVTFSKARASMPHSAKARRNVIKRKQDSIEKYRENSKNLIKKCNI